MINSYKSTNTYDANDNKLTELFESWLNNAWVNNGKYTYTYDANGNSSTGKFEEWLNNNWEMNSYGDLDVYSSKNNIFSLYQIARFEAHFVSFTTGINENSNKQINIYPNPATSNLTINLQQLTKLQNTTVSIYDIQGKLLLQQSITQQQTELNISSFAKGIYIVKLNNNNMQSKFVKE
ncbi:MAG: T9SS type A sorting domain-containing protein [Bacteroidales bacterium]